MFNVCNVVPISEAAAFATFCVTPSSRPLVRIFEGLCQFDHALVEPVNLPGGYAVGVRLVEPVDAELISAVVLLHLRLERAHAADAIFQLVKRFLIERAFLREPLADGGQFGRDEVPLKLGDGTARGADLVFHRGQRPERRYQIRRGVLRIERIEQTVEGLRAP